MTGFTISKHGHTRFWAVRDSTGSLICVCVYKRGALEVVRRLSRETDSDVNGLREPPLGCSGGPERVPPDASDGQ